MANPDEFRITASDDMDMTCPVNGCWEWIRIDNSDTLAAVRQKAARHLAEKHVAVIDGTLVSQ